jgi:hypothetical protein
LKFYGLFSRFLISMLRGLSEPFCGPGEVPLPFLPASDVMAHGAMLRPAA